MTKKHGTTAWPGDRERSLFKALVALAGDDECQRFLLDLCTPAELTAMADRWRVAQLIARHVPYREIRTQTGVSTATITRVARALLYGENGYRDLIEKTKPEFKPEYRVAKLLEHRPPVAAAAPRKKEARRA
jgi:TrpR-related protein YerC/YecD